MIPVYCLPGYSSSPRMRDDHLSGQLFRAPFDRRDVLYPNKSAKKANAEAGAAMVAELAAKPGKKIFFGHSMGARALAMYLRTNPSVDPAENVFVFTGNPERKYGGRKPTDYGGPGVPDDTPFRVFDVARQYEFWADYPDKPSKAAAAKNCLDGEIAGLFGGKSLHMDYSNVRIGDPSNAVFVEGNRTYILAPTFPAPSARRLWWDVKREGIEDAKIRSEIEGGYTRPFTAPTSTVKWYPGGGGYDADSRSYVTPQPAPTWNPFA